MHRLYDDERSVCYYRCGDVVDVEVGQYELTANKQQVNINCCVAAFMCAESASQKKETDVVLVLVRERPSKDYFLSLERG